MFTTVRPKSLYGNSVNGSMLAHLAQVYCSALNSNQAPSLRTAWERVAEQQCQDALEKAVAVYKAELGSKAGSGSGDSSTGVVVLEHAELHAAHTAALQRAVGLFDKDAVQVRGIAVLLSYHAS